jgi:hypothetical protein
MQVFTSLYNSDDNCFVCAPTGSGKTICAGEQLIGLGVPALLTPSCSLYRSTRGNRSQARDLHLLQLTVAAAS